MEQRGLDWQEAFDWKVLGEEIRDRANPYQAIWSKLQAEYGVTKPLSQQEQTIEIARWEQEEAQNLMKDKDGVRELLRRIYKDPTVPETKKSYYKELLLEVNPAGLATAIALYDGEEKEFAKRFLGEEVVPMTTKEMRDAVSHKKYVRILSGGGYIKAIDGRYLDKPVKAADFVAEAGECSPIPGSGEKVATGKNPDGSIKWGYLQIYQCKREHPVYLKPIDPNLKVDPIELRMGIEVEMKEHSDDYEIGKTIALHHLAEHPYYYTHLIKMEEDLKNLEKTMQPILEFINKIPAVEVKQVVKIEPKPSMEEYAITPSLRVEELASSRGSSEITRLARQNNIPITNKIKMITALIQKGVKI